MRTNSNSPSVSGVPSLPGRLLSCLALLSVLSVVSVQSQYLPVYALHALDSALGAIQMNRSDLSMRWDAAGLDSHRLAVVSRLFGDPISTLSLSDSLAASGLKWGDDPIRFLNYLGQQLDLGPTPFHESRPTAGDQEIALGSKIDLNKLDFSSALLLRRHLALAIATDAAVVSNRGTLAADRIQRLVEYADSLLLQTEGAGEASLVEMKEAERYGLKRNKQFFNVDASGIDYARLLDPGVTLYCMALGYAHTMASEMPGYRDKIRTQTFETPLGLVAIGGAGDDLYTGDFFCIVDIGGNDVYRPSHRTKEKAVEKGVSLIVDFDGDDLYIGDDYAFGGTLFGASTLIDLKGDDSYTARNFSLGCGYFGVGILYDGEGRDRYSGGTAVEGAGLFGIGLIFDRKGNDNYLAHLTSQGFGYTRGVGGIIESEGNDSYIAASPYTDYLRYDDHFETFSQGAALGARPVASAGIGLIAEGSGNDTYLADIYGQGTAYWFGLGAIVDSRGNDSYSAFQYAQGSGVHLAFGALIDSSGNDNYVSHGVSQGCGHDIAFGGLYDANGDDNYIVESLSLGGGNANAISLFIDGGGEDGYLARRDNTLGFSDLRRQYGMIGIFLDLERKDFYGTSRGGNDSLWIGSYYGVGLDGEIRPKDPDQPDPGQPGPTKSKEEIEKELAKDIPTLFIQASAAPQKWQFIVGPAQARLVERADESLPFLLGQLDTESPREALALGFILPKMGKRVLEPLIDTVRHGEIGRVGRALYALGELKDTNAAVAIGEKLIDTTVSWRMRSAAGEAILKLNAHSAKPYLKKALLDTFEIVRGYAARALVMVADSAELIEMLPLLNDRSQIVRYQVQLAMKNRGIDTIANAFVPALLSQKSGYSSQLLYALAGDLKNPEARGRLLDGLLKDPSPKVRLNGVRLALRYNDSESLSRAATLRGHERDPAVLEELKKIDPSVEPYKAPKNGETKKVTSSNDTKKSDRKSSDRKQSDKKKSSKKDEKGKKGKEESKRRR